MICRRLIAFASAFSLLVCLATAMLWARSAFVSDYFEWTTGYGEERAFDIHQFWIGCHGGGLFVWEYLHIQQGGAGGAYRLPAGRHFSWERDSKDLSYPASALTFTRQFKGGTLTYNRLAGCEFLLARVTYAEYGFCDRTFYVLCRLPFIVLATGITPAVWAFVSIRRRRMARLVGRRACPNCSYDLTGNISGVCPECGTAIMLSVRYRGG